MRPILLLLLVLCLGLLVGSLFYPGIEQVSVSGNQRLGREEIMRLARVVPGAPLLWVNRWSLAGLQKEPWIERSRVIRHWPDTVSITVWERKPALTDGVTVWASDGTPLPGVNEETKAQLVRLEGWGGDRLDESLRLLELLSPFEPRVISYSPEGFDIELAETRLFTPGIAVLERHWAAWTNQRGRRVAVYPWGVSEKDD